MKEKKWYIKYKWNVISIASLTIIIDVAYVYYYYKQVNFNTLLTNFVITLNYIGTYVVKLINMIINEEILKIIIIGCLIIYGIEKFKLVDSIKQFNSFEFKDFKMSKEKLKENTEQIIHKDIVGNDQSNNNIKLIEQLFIDCPFIVSLVDSYINRNFRDITINLNIIPEKVRLEQIGVIFEYKIKSNSIIIKNMKKDIEAIVIDVFKDFQSKGIIYVEK